MIISPKRYAQKFFAHARIHDLYKDIRSYLPRRRRREFMRAWIINNLIVGPHKRARFERKLGCVLPSLINISPSQKCNLSCLGCYAADYSRHAEMSTQQVARIVAQVKELGIHMIGFLGGEPLLRKDLFDVIEKNKDVAFRISTNGTIINSEIIERLKRCGNVVLFLSLEGFDGETDEWRGSGVYARIMTTMAILRQERILFGFSALVHKKNRDAIVSEKFINAMQDAGCRFGIFFPYGPAGSRARYDLRLSEEEIDAVYDDITAMEGGYVMLLRKEGYFPRDPAKNSPADQGCRAGVSVHITPEGFVEPCNGLQFYTENVFEKDIREIFQSPFYHDIFSCVQQHGKRCISMFRPEEVLRIIKKHGARGSHQYAIPTYTDYAEMGAPATDVVSVPQNSDQEMEES